MQRLAHIISVVCHPLLMATYGCLLLFFGLTNSIYATFTPLYTKFVITSIVFVFTFLIPILNLLILYKLNYVSSLQIKNRRERVFPLLMTAICYFGLFYLIYEFNIWPAIKLFILGGGIIILVTALITIKWQISAHLMGIGGFVGMLLAFRFFMQMPLLIFICAFILLAGVIGFARLQLQAHVPSQVYVGFIIGCVLQFGLFTLAKFILFI